jgi:major membrane immunogen (membrane-anchored lipoprotein)
MLKMLEWLDTDYFATLIILIFSVIGLIVENHKQEKTIEELEGQLKREIKQSNNAKIHKGMPEIQLKTPKFKRYFYDYQKDKGALQ